MCTFIIWSDWLPPVPKKLMGNFSFSSCLGILYQMLFAIFHADLLYFLKEESISNIHHRLQVLYNLLLYFHPRAQSCAIIYLLWNLLLMPKGWLGHTVSNAWKRCLAPQELSSKLTQFKQIEQGSRTEKLNKTKKNLFPCHIFAKVQKMALNSRERYLTNIHPFKYIEF